METYSVVSDDRDGVLGYGASGSVFKVRRRSDNKILARKTIRYDKANKGKPSVEVEYRIVLDLDFKHPNIIQYFDVTWGTREAQLYMEYCDLGDLNEEIQTHEENKTRPLEDEVWRILYQLVSALSYCHHGALRQPDGGLKQPGQFPWKPILHRDIKPSNVFLSRDRNGKKTIKLGDFGLGVVLYDDFIPNSYAGTRLYMPPEVTRSAPSWSTKCDVYSFGCTLYAFCTGKPPFKDHRDDNEEEFVPLPDTYSQDLRLVIDKCIAFQPVQRPDAYKIFVNAEDYVDEATRASVSTFSTKKRLSISASWDIAHEALQIPQLGTTKTLKENGREVKERGQNDWTALHSAARNGRLEVVKWLKEQGADISERNNNGFPLSYVAAQNGHLEVVKWLKEQRADIHEKHKGSGWTTLHTAAFNGHLEVVKWLLEQGADFREKNNDGATCLYLGAQNGRLEVVKWLKEQGADIFERNNNGFPLSYVAAQNGRLEVLKWLKEQSADIHEKHKGSGWTTLHTAALNGHLEVVKWLLEQGADFREKNKNGATSLDLAAGNGHLEVVKWLKWQSS